jgi:molybdenum cofactor cytidylyltransferase
MRSSPRIGCAILAAGAGKRFGAPGDKLVATLGGKALVQHSIDAACASGASAVTLVLGAASERVLSIVDARRAAAVVNAGWVEGIASSIRTALALRAGDDACILMLGDQPHVEAGDLNAMIAAYLHRPNAIVALRRDRIWGAPVLFPASDFPIVSRLRGDAGAKRYALEQPQRLVFVRAARADAFADVDSRSDVKPQDGRRTR